LGLQPGVVLHVLVTFVKPYAPGFVSTPFLVAKSEPGNAPRVAMEALPGSERLSPKAMTSL
jgi:hypothetical protein